ncbi:MAG: ZIP family metal transporter [Ardenticatenaceae bacterium]|nr:ZIP family metal transporter [Ardenticatenaceae bacterium]
MWAIFAILPFFSTLLGGIAALRLRHRLHLFMAFAAGVVVATALADLLPEAEALIGEQTGTLALTGVAAVIGYLIFVGLEALVHQLSFGHQHAHGEELHRVGDHEQPHEAQEHRHEAPPAGVIGLVAPAGLIVHSTLDGLAIGLGFRTNTEVGLLVAFAVLAHDFADGMNVVTLAFAGGQSRLGATAFLVLDALAPLVGAAIAVVATLSDMVLGLLLATFAGVFLAIGAGHLLPEAQHRPGGAPRLVILTIVGAAVVVAIRSVIG